MNQEKIGKFIAQCRKEKNMTQQRLADILGVSDKAVSKWENGRGMPDISVLEPLSKHLGVSLNELIKGERIGLDKIVEATDENLKESLLVNRKERKWCRILLILCGIAVLLSPLILLNIGETFHIPQLSYSIKSVMKDSENFYRILASKDYEKIKSVITDDEEQWHSRVVDYSLEKFIANLQSLEEKNIEYTTFTPKKYSWNEKFLVEYEVCFRRASEDACIEMLINKVEDKYHFEAFVNGERTPFQRELIDIFTPYNNYFCDNYYNRYQC